jgi:hypothetical protein
MIATHAFVQECFNRFNAEMFMGKLPKIPIVLTATRQQVACIRCKRIKGKCSNFSLRVSNILDLPQKMLEDVVIHELIHLCILSNGINDTSAHGTVFKAMMGKINTQWHRNITIKVDIEPEMQTARATGASRWMVFCLIKFKDGRNGITMCARTAVVSIAKTYARVNDILSVTWYCTSDLFFAKFPRSRTARVYNISDEEIAAHVTNSKAVQPLTIKPHLL